MVAKVEKALEKKFERGLKDTRIAIFGATGVVGFCTAVIAAKEGAKVTIVGHDGVERVKKVAAEIKSRFGVDVEAADGSTDASKKALVEASRSDPDRRQGGRAGDLQGAAEGRRRAC